jgi:hypothetical protein
VQRLQEEDLKERVPAEAVVEEVFLAADPMEGNSLRPDEQMLLLMRYRYWDPMEEIRSHDSEREGW